MQDNFDTERDYFNSKIEQLDQQNDSNELRQQIDEVKQQK